MLETALLNTYRAWLARLVAAEQDDGWLEACDRAGLFLAPCQELVQSLAELLARLAGDLGWHGHLARGETTLARRQCHPCDPLAKRQCHPPVMVLEVCAGSGELAVALSAAGVTIEATDADPPPGCGVERRTAAEALGHYRPAVVLGSFVPFDSQVDAAVLDCPSVQHYVVLGARIGGAFGSAELWKRAGWQSRALEPVRRWMLTRHDVWLGPAPEALLMHAEAWLFSRTRNGSGLWQT